MILNFLRAAQALRVDPRFGREQARDEFLARHLEREDCDRALLLARHGDRHRQRHRGLPHRRAGRQDDEVSGLETGRVLVDVAETRRHAGAVAVAVIEPVDLLERPLEELVNRDELAMALVAPDVVDDLLGAVDRAVDVLFVLEADLGDHRPGVDQPAQGRLLANDLGVVLGRGGGRHRLHQGAEIREAADSLEGVAVTKLFGDRDLVERLAAFVELKEPGVDRLVDVRVEIRRPHDLADGCHHLAVDEDRAEDRHFGFEVVRRDPIGAAGDRSRRDSRHQRRLAARRGTNSSASSASRTSLTATTSIPLWRARTSRSFSLGINTSRIPAWRAA